MGTLDSLFSETGRESQVDRGVSNDTSTYTRNSTRQSTTQGTRSETPCQRMPILRRNERQARAEDLVKVLQQLLNKADLHPSTGGFPLTVDGFFGAKTEVVVKQYQAQNRLLIDGIVGPKTWNALGACIIITES